MTVGQIFTIIGIFIENRRTFTLLNCNCAKLVNLEDFLNMLRGRFSWTHCRLMFSENNTTTNYPRDPAYCTTLFNAHLSNSRGTCPNFGRKTTVHVQKWHLRYKTKRSRAMLLQSVYRNSCSGLLIGDKSGGLA